MEGFGNLDSLIKAFETRMHQTCKFSEIEDIETFMHENISALELFINFQLHNIWSETEKMANLCKKEEIEYHQDE